MSELEPYLVPGVFIDSDDADVRAFAARRAAGADGALARAVRLYYAVRDEIPYDPYYVGADRAYFRASDCLRAGRGFCIPKAALLAAAARALGVPARVGYADVRNHLTTKRLAELVGGDLYVWHGYTELHLEGSWVKATPAFNLSLCERFGVRPLEFDGRQDSLFHPFDRAGRRHMEYVRERGHFADVPYEAIVRDFDRAHPRWLTARAAGARADFAGEASADPPR
ncbi:MAG TPA: transglutaminase family protein [Candidatus Rokubacteria bacterium]|nr:MAG: transglutaminase [Candidatus Rokubacteria bacterium GWA2_73_35]HBH03538.1 transglutaminase family protein [Candidatus Rokubacteria bacterium]